MVSFFVIVACVPLLAAVVAYVVLDGISRKELACIVAAQVAVAACSAGVVSCGKTYDVEVWNGTVTGKKQVWTSCSHSYQCNCRQVCTGSGSSRSCTTECDTCYEHSNDWDWQVYTSNGETVTINRVDRRGSDEPPRWTAVSVGEPTSLTHMYTNYVKAAPGTLFRRRGAAEKYARSLPPYPGNVYDYYRLDRLVTVGVAVPDARQWNVDLMRANAELGRAKQVNLIVVLVKGQPREWHYALEESWIGGKKNDVVLVVGVDDDMRAQWVEVMAWTDSKTLNTKLRDDIAALPSVQREPTLEALTRNVRDHYRRKPMKDFEYLKSSIVPSAAEWVITLTLALAVAAGMVWGFQTHDVFGDERFSYRRARSAGLFGARF